MDLQVFGTTFALLLLMELGDKTQLAVLSLTAKTGQPLAVFLGATLGLTAVTLLAVTLGAVILAFIPSEWVSQGAGIAFILIGAFILWAALRNSTEEGSEDPGASTKTRSALGVVAGTSGLLFVAEMGDKTQLTVIGLTAQSGTPLTVFAGAVTALAAVTLLAVLIGQAITRLIPVRHLTIGAGVIFIAIGFLTLGGVL